MEPEFFRRTFEKSPNNKFHKNPSCGSPVVLSGRTDRHEVNCCLSQFC